MNGGIVCLIERRKNTWFRVIISIIAAAVVDDFHRTRI